MCCRLQATQRPDRPGATKRENTVARRGVNANDDRATTKSETGYVITNSDACDLLLGIGV